MTTVQPSMPDAFETFRVLARLVRLITHGDPTGNPYGHDEVMNALELLGRTSGVEDPYDVDTARIAEE